ncbi:MAG: exodeoxyribonuclease V subunit beta [Deltaproteobacteria bacterium]|nr:exodeoxyribonuclease V subunit beta [Deltaproteobacteria bacterium]
MEEIRQFDLLNCPLEGTNLIEASAGTGKTYAICGLFVRLVLEKRLSVDRILVVTFTEAATAELKERIRVRLRDAIAGFSQGTTSKDEFIDALVEKHKGQPDAEELLKDAIRDFDEAAIFTIHGFCGRMLHENAFESGALFDAELICDQEDLKRESVEDFWRKRFYNKSHLFLNYAASKVNIEAFFSLFAIRGARPYLKIAPDIETPDSSATEQEYKASRDKVVGAWPRARAEVEEILLSDNGLNRNSYRLTSIPVWIREMDDLAASGDNNPFLFDAFRKFTSDVIKDAVKKKHVAPTHLFFDLCQELDEKHKELEQVFEQCLCGLKKEMFDYVQKELDRKKEAKNVLFFDDLLLNLHRALEAEGGQGLARAAGAKFSAALIDEFQDTDPIQYEIFKKSFADQGSILFLIGDPKQAIYGFRGADVFAYMKAARHVKSRYTLGKNWRSEPGLITAVNVLFQGNDHPFIYKDIPFHPATPGKTGNRTSLQVDGSTGPSLAFLLLNAEKITGSAKPLKKPEAREFISKAVAAEISGLLRLAADKRATLGNDPLRQGDIAVLVRRNADARLMREALSALNIPSVSCSTESVFASHEAVEMRRVLSGILQPNNEIFLKAAFATDMIGVNGEELNSLTKDEAGWEERLIRFRTYHATWQDHGFIRMFKRMMTEENILSRLMTLPDGERRNTNLLHLAEVLHQASTERDAGMADLVKWLSGQTDSGESGPDEYQLRLETDENAVKLITVHKSKGLEYPVVFCPFAWDGSRARDSRPPYMFHDESEEMTLTLDLGPEVNAKSKVLAETEALAENVRLLYVALTRARNRCYFVWGRINLSGTSAPAWLFHYKKKGGKGILDAIEARYKALTDNNILAEVKSVAKNAPYAITISEMSDRPGRVLSGGVAADTQLTWRKFSGKIDSTFRISSFSSITSALPYSAETADHDAAIDADRGAQPGLEQGPLVEETIFSFPKGARPGTFMHDIFEHLDFTQAKKGHAERLVAEKLVEHGFDRKWRKAICTMVRKVVSGCLEPGRDDFTLSRIENKDRLNELEFYFPIGLISPKKLRDLFREPLSLNREDRKNLTLDFTGPVERLGFSPVRGFMKGFIDMVFQFEGRFYIVDWKSNFLGPSVEDYNQGALDAVMKEDGYMLQYYIYTVAVDRYLRTRIPAYDYERDFGGVYYIFLRGVDPDKGPDFGIYRSRPDRRFIDRLSTNLINGQKGSNC